MKALAYKFSTKICCFISLFFIMHANAGTNLDSLYKAWKNISLPDSVRLQAIDDFIWEGCINTNADSALYLSQLQYKFATEKNLKKYQAIALKNQGIAYSRKGDYDNAIVSNKLGLAIFQSINDKNGMAATNSNIGLALVYKAKYIESLDYYFKALKIAEEIGDKKRSAAQLLNISNSYIQLNNITKGLAHLDKAKKMYETIGYKPGVSNCLNIAGDVFLENKEYDKALTYFNEALKINESSNIKIDLATSYVQLADVYHKKAVYSQLSNKKSATDSLNSVSLNYCLKAEEIAENIGAKYTLSTIYGNLGLLLKDINDDKKAEKYFEKALAISNEINAESQIVANYNNLTSLYYKTGRYKLAFDNYSKYIILRDTLLNRENDKKLVQKELKNDFDKKVIEYNVKRAEERKVTDAELQKERTQRFALFGGLILTLIFSVLIFNRLKITRNQKKIIELQKLETEQQNNEITSSIRYAKRIQAAILPSNATITSLFEKSFVLYKPKDIVAGDFYWFVELNENIIFAAADCTGHGVPGAMVSVVCNNALNRCVKEFGIIEPGKILDKAREIIISEFEKSDGELQDGMDISLCCLNSSKNELQWAGANNPLLIIRDNELIEIKPDKQPIGKYSYQKVFTTHTMVLQPNDTIYVFTDGYQDQFGGEHGKKFKAANLKNMLLSVQNESMMEQKVIINTTFEKWKGSIEQVDDVCIIGVKI